MAGMLPGVECARRRRIHQGGWNSTHDLQGIGTRRSSFCLYTSSNESHFTSHSSLRNSSNNQIIGQDEKLGGVVREAKGRLDEKLRNSLRKSDVHTKRSNIKERKKIDESGGVVSSVVDEELRKEVFGLKSSSRNSSSKRFISWPKLIWKSSNQEECAICLEKFQSGQELVHLRCEHRFHWRCLVPWLEANAHCPYCRLEI